MPCPLDKFINTNSCEPLNIMVGRCSNSRFATVWNVLPNYHLSSKIFETSSQKPKTTFSCTITKPPLINSLYYYIASCNKKKWKESILDECLSMTPMHVWFYIPPANSSTDYTVLVLSYKDNLSGFIQLFYHYLNIFHLTTPNIFIYIYNLCTCSSSISSPTVTFVFLKEQKEAYHIHLGTLPTYSRD